MTPRDRWPSYPTPAPACAWPSQGLFMLGRLFCYIAPLHHHHPQLSQRAPVEPWKPHELSRGLSKTCSVCPLLLKPIKVCSCPPEL